MERCVAYLLGIGWLCRLCAMSLLWLGLDFIFEYLIYFEQRSANWFRMSVSCEPSRPIPRHRWWIIDGLYHSLTSPISVGKHLLITHLTYGFEASQSASLLPRLCFEWSMKMYCSLFIGVYFRYGRHNSQTEVIAPILCGLWNSDALGSLEKWFNRNECWLYSWDVVCQNLRQKNPIYNSNGTCAQVRLGRPIYSSHRVTCDDNPKHQDAPRAPPIMKLLANSIYLGQMVTLWGWQWLNKMKPQTSNRFIPNITRSHPPGEFWDLF